MMDFEALAKKHDATDYSSYWATFQNMTDARRFNNEIYNKLDIMGKLLQIHGVWGVYTK